MTALAEACRQVGVRQGYMPMFLAGFAEAEIVGSCQKLADPLAPAWDTVHVENAEAIGCGTIAFDPDEDQIVPHVHTSLELHDVPLLTFGR